MKGNKKETGFLPVMEPSKKKKTLCLGGVFQEEWRGGGCLVYLGAELGFLVTSKVMTALNKQALGMDAFSTSLLLL